MPSTPDNRPRTVVMLQYSGIGDLIWHIAYFKAIANQSLGGRVTVVAQPSTLVQAFWGKAPWVEKIIEHDHRPRRTEKRRGRHAGLIGMWRMAQELRSGHYDRIVLFSGRISRGLIAALSGIPDRRGYGYRWLQRIFLTQGPFIEAHQGPSVAAYPDVSVYGRAAFLKLADACVVNDMGMVGTRTDAQIGQRPAIDQTPDYRLTGKYLSPISPDSATAGLTAPQTNQTEAAKNIIT